MNDDTENVASLGLETQLDLLSIYRSYLKSPYLSLKHSSYFQVYTDLFKKYRGQSFTFVEIGVLNGGSLFMWRDYFGKKARIIGIDLNPKAVRWEQYGFEIYVGSQSDPSFWRDFFSQVGMVDVVIDDGGHTYEQQIITAHHCIPHINDGGLLVVEDTHTSYFVEFGYPSKYTFIEWTKKVIDTINGRFNSIADSNQVYGKYIYSVRHFESVACFEIDRRKCLINQPIKNNGKTLDVEDLRYVGTNVESINELIEYFAKKFKFFSGKPMAKFIVNSVIPRLQNVLFRISAGKLKKYF